MRLLALLVLCSCASQKQAHVDVEHAASGTLDLHATDDDEAHAREKATTTTTSEPTDIDEHERLRIFVPPMQAIQMLGTDAGVPLDAGLLLVERDREKHTHKGGQQKVQNREAEKDTSEKAALDLHVDAGVTLAAKADSASSVKPAASCAAGGALWAVVIIVVVVGLLLLRFKSKPKD